MWQLVAAIAIIVNGVHVGPPHKPATYRAQQFPTEQACKDFVASPAGLEVLAALVAIERVEHPGATPLIAPECKSVGTPI